MATAGVTYAYLSLSDVQTTSNVISTSCFDVGFSETGDITPLSYPMNSGTAFTKNPYKFTISKANSCTTNINYQIYLNVINTSDLDASLMRYSMDGKTEKTLSSKVSLPVGADSTGISASYLIETGTLTEASEAKNLYLWIAETAGNDIMGKQFKTQILVYSQPQAN